MKKLCVLVLGVVFCVGVQTAGAAGLIDVDGTWTGSVGGSNVSTSEVALPGGTYGNDTEQQIRWGVPYHQPNQSGLGFTPVVDSATMAPVGITYGTPFEIGQLQHYNYTILVVSAIDTADLGLVMTIGNGGTDTASVSLTFSVDETPNGSVVGGVPDVIGFPSGAFSQIVTLGGVDYDFEFVGFGPDADNLATSFISPEGGTNSTLLWGTLTERSTVPAPGALLLTSIGAWAVGMIRRRRAL